MTDARNKKLVAEILGSWDAGDFAYIESFHHMSERETARSRLAPRASLDSCPQTPQRKYHKIAMLNCRLAACSRFSLPAQQLTVRDLGAGWASFIAWRFTGLSALMPPSTSEHPIPS